MIPNNLFLFAGAKNTWSSYKTFATARVRMMHSNQLYIFKCQFVLYEFQDTLQVGFFFYCFFTIQGGKRTHIGWMDKKGKNLWHLAGSCLFLLCYYVLSPSCSCVILLTNDWTYNFFSGQDCDGRKIYWPFWCIPFSLEG